MNFSICVFINCDSDSWYFLRSSCETPLNTSWIVVELPQRFSPWTTYSLSPVPSRSNCFLSGDTSSNFLFIGISLWSQNSLKVRENHVSEFERLKKGKIPPSLIVKLLLNTRSGSILRTVPRPVQAGHAPCGVLNEKSRGSTSGSEILSNGQANFSENNWSSISFGRSGISKDASWIIETIISPSPNCSACSTSVATRLRSVSLVSVMLSIASSIVCLLVLIRTISSSRS